MASPAEGGGRGHSTFQNCKNNTNKKCHKYRKMPPASEGSIPEYVSEYLSTIPREQSTPNLSSSAASVSSRLVSGSGHSIDDYSSNDGQSLRARRKEEAEQRWQLREAARKAKEADDTAAKNWLDTLCEICKNRDREIQSNQRRANTRKSTKKKRRRSTRRRTQRKRIKKKK